MLRSRAWKTEREPRDAEARFGMSPIRLHVSLWARPAGPAAGKAAVRMPIRRADSRERPLRPFRGRGVAASHNGNDQRNAARPGVSGRREAPAARKQLADAVVVGGSVDVPSRHPLHDLGGGDRSTDQKALEVVASDLHQNFALGDRLDALGDDLDTDVVAEIGDHADERLIVGMVDRADERTVDLDRVDWQML